MNSEKGAFTKAIHRRNAIKALQRSVGNVRASEQVVKRRLPVSSGSFRQAYGSERPKLIGYTE